MNRQRRQKFNSVNAPALARWIVIFTFLGVTGLSYVYLSIQLHKLGAEKTKLEGEIAAVAAQTEDANVQIAALTSHTALQRRLQEGYLKMHAITDDHIVKLGPHARPLTEDRLQPVANERGDR